MKRVDAKTQRTLIVVAGIIILAILGFILIKTAIPSQEDSVQVSGESIIEVTPDLITIYYNVETQAKTSKEAEDLNAEIVSKLREAASEYELKTQSFNIYPEYDWSSSTRRLIGYKASHSLKIELSAEETGKIGELIDAGANAGAGISYINFELSNELEQQYKAEAIKLAAADAKLKAEAIAEGFDKKVGKLVSVSLNNFNYYPYRAYDFAESGASIELAKEATTQITPSDQEVSAYVNAVYKLK